ncbi:MAG: hypothetical protein HC828_08555 [Blastochloris sp.]|nr:hypothetical protein [Blastochloris sp.]
MQTLFIYGLIIIALLLGMLWLLWHMHRVRRANDHAGDDRSPMTVVTPTPPVVPGIVVSDTTPITHLAAIGYLELLQGLYGSIMLPEAVYQELTAFRSPGAAEAHDYAWITIIVLTRQRYSSCSRRCAV